MTLHLYTELAVFKKMFLTCSWYRSYHSNAHLPRQLVDIGSGPDGVGRIHELDPDDSRRWLGLGHVSEVTALLGAKR